MVRIRLREMDSRRKQVKLARPFRKVVGTMTMTLETESQTDRTRSSQRTQPTSSNSTAGNSQPYSCETDAPPAYSPHDLRKRVEDLEIEVATLLSLRQSQDSQITRLTTELDQVKQNNTELTAQITALQGELDDPRKEAEHLTALLEIKERALRKRLQNGGDRQVDEGLTAVKRERGVDELAVEDIKGKKPRN